MSQAVAGYEALATDLIAPYEAIDTERLYKPVSDVTPRSGEDLLDIGAGTGRDGAHWRAQGSDVVCVDPVSALWAHPEILCLNDALPDLEKTSVLERQFDVITLTGVWHHLSQAERDRAMPVLARLIRPGGRILMHLRNGPTPQDRPGFPVNPSREAQMAARYGLKTLFQRPARSIQPQNIASGVRWTWLGLRKAPT